MRLTALDDLLPPFLAEIEPVAPVILPLEHAAGLRLADDLLAPDAVPAAAVALRAGLAVAALDLVGASAHSPVPLPRSPPLVKAGEILPAGCDAIVDPSAVSADGPVAEAAEAVEPGAHVRLRGHDFGAGQVIARIGARVTPEIVLAARLAGLSQALVRAPAVRIDMPASLEADWLRRRLRALGMVESSGEAAVDLIIAPSGDAGARLALRPGEDAFFRRAFGGVVEVALPSRFDGIVGAWCALILPTIARLTGGSLKVRRRELARKIVSSIGMAEVVLLRCEAGLAHPLAVGDLTLAAVAAADSFVVMPAGSEGLGVGGAVDAVAFDDAY